jgi:hypothetical protein
MGREAAVEKIIKHYGLFEFAIVADLNSGAGTQGQGKGSGGEIGLRLLPYHWAELSSQILCGSSFLLHRLLQLAITFGTSIFLGMQYSIINFFSMHGNLPRGVDSDPDLIAFDAQDSDRNFITNLQTFTSSSR